MITIKEETVTAKTALAFIGATIDVNLNDETATLGVKIGTVNFIDGQNPQIAGRKEFRITQENLDAAEPVENMPKIVDLVEALRQIAHREYNAQEEKRLADEQRLAEQRRLTLEKEMAELEARRASLAEQVEG